VREELKNKNKIVVISQDKLEIGMKSLVKRLNLHFENEKGIDEVKWFNEEFVMEIKEEENPVSIVIQGTMEFISEINTYLLNKIGAKYPELRIINCYEVYNSNAMLYNILDEHDFVFNTAGMNSKSEVFPGYIEPAKILNS
jgi:hypothetical protein